MSEVTIFAPSPTLTITVEEHPSGSEVHIHAGGQGVWQARMLVRLGVSVEICAVLTGETGQALRHLLLDEGIEVAAISRQGRGSAYVHDRRGGERVVIAEEDADPLGRHELDELYGLMLARGIDAGLAILSGPADETTLPADTYRRLAADLREGGARVLVDLAGERLEAAVSGGIDVLKVSDEELLADGLIVDRGVPEIMRAMRKLRELGAHTVIVSRSSDPFLLLDEEGYLEVTPPLLEEVDSRGAGDSLVAGIAAGLVRGDTARAAAGLGAASGALNVTRHGLGTGDRETIETLRTAVTTRVVTDGGDAEQRISGRISPDGLASLAEDEPDAQGGGR